MNLKQIAIGFRSLLRDKGPRATFSSLVDRLRIRWFEWRLGINSESIIELKDLGFNNELYRPYVPTDYRTFRRVLDALRIRPGEDVFLDFGSGLGRAVILAGLHPFRRIIGVEIAPQLNEVARQNVCRALHRLKCHDIEIVAADATKFVVPGDVTVVYFYNPFCGEVLTRVLANIRESLAGKQRSLRILCKVPAQSRFEEEIRQHAWLIPEREMVFDAQTRYLLLVAKG